MQSKADTVLPPAVNSIRANTVIKGSLLSLYDTVTWNGVTFNGHWSWIYVAHNDPMINGKHIWQWMAKQRVKLPISTKWILATHALPPRCGQDRGWGLAARLLGKEKRHAQSRITRRKRIEEPTLAWRERSCAQLRSVERHLRRWLPACEQR